MVCIGGELTQVMYVLLHYELYHPRPPCFSPVTTAQLRPSFRVAVFLHPRVSAIRGADSGGVGLQAGAAGLCVRVGDPTRLLHRVHAHDLGRSHVAEAVVVGDAAASGTRGAPVFRDALLARLWIVSRFGASGRLRPAALVWHRWRRGWRRVAVLLLPAASAVCFADVRRMFSNARVARGRVRVGRRRVQEAAAALQLVDACDLLRCHLAEALAAHNHSRPWKSVAAVRR